MPRTFKTRLPTERKDWKELVLLLGRYAWRAGPYRAFPGGDP